MNGKTILVTGGTGSFGKSFVSHILKNYSVKKIIIFSRDEMKQWDMAKKFDEDFFRYFIGDVRDKERLQMAFEGVDYVVHAAATKIVPTAEYDPFECVKTNVHGAMNVISASLNSSSVKSVVALSTDKASSPINLYGATKLCSDKVFIAGNSYSGDTGTTFSVVRYGNVVGSRGSVVPIFAKQREKDGVLTITHPEMTRFLITLQEGVDFVLKSLESMVGGELFVPKIPACKVSDIASLVAPGCKWEVIGMRPGEKMHEILIPEDEARNVLEFENHFVVQPIQSFWGNKIGILGGVSCPENFRFASNVNCETFTDQELRDLLSDYIP